MLQNSSVKADPTTIVVPDNYPTIQLAIDAAKEGDTIYFKKGYYEGPVNQTLEINKAMTLLGEDKDTTTLKLSPPYVKMNIFTYEYMGYLDAIKINSNNVRVSGLTIDAPGGGINGNGDHIQIVSIISTIGLSIEGAHITISENKLKGDLGIVGNNNVIKNNRFEIGLVRPFVSCVGPNNIFSNNSLAIQDETSNIKLEIKGNNNYITHNLLAAIHLYGDSNIIYKNSIKALPGDCGIYLSQSFRNMICGNRISYAKSITYEQEGIFLSESGDNRVYANHIEGLFKGVNLENTDTRPMVTNNNKFYLNNFINNKIQAWDYTSSTTNNFDNGKEGNYWSDYGGKDLDNDGIGDTPFKPTYVYTYGELVEKVTKCNPDNFPLMTPFNIDNITVDLPEWVSLLLGSSPTPSFAASPAPTLQPDSTPTPESNYHNSLLSDNTQVIIITIIVAVLAVVIVSLLLYNKRFKSK
ncbi:MAG TPA: NosD domain-containing protein [Candidatus Acidoferrales bacterium]|nr:NosD domain-containing protein [Candidatus Acidoferrales bacterium]